MAAVSFAGQIGFVTKRLKDDLAGIDGLAKIEISTVENFLLTEGVTSLGEVDLSLLVSYRTYVRKNLEQGKWKHFGSLLETVMLRFLSPFYRELIKEIDGALSLSRAEGNKAKMFLMVSDVRSIKNITYKDRRAFEEYLVSCGSCKVMEYSKILDRLKLAAIRRECEKSFGLVRKLIYSDDVLFLGYHPDIRMAMEFYYIRDKEELVFDFSMNVPPKLKRQVFKMLTHCLEMEMKRKNRRELYLVPLKKLYLYCAEEGIEDIEKMTGKQVAGFYRSMAGKVGTKTKTYMQIVGTTRKYLFLSAERTNWDALVWYLDRFTFKNERVNPSMHIDCFRFTDILDEENCSLFREYMRYLVALSGRALSSVQARYYVVRAFCAYCDRENKKVTDFTADDMDDYAAFLETKEREDATFNASIDALAAFFDYLNRKGRISRSPVRPEYYRKKTVYVHHDRSVTWEVQMDLVNKLKFFPEHLRLMCLTVWSTGIRVNEMCTIRGGALSFDGEDAFLTVMQYKMSSEKKIPIPAALYELLKEYIERNKTGRDEFVFRSKKGRAYDASTFRVQVQRLCRKYGIGSEDYIYRPHDYRHTVATEMFDEGVSLQAIRDYHGHRDEGMTKQYIDYMPGRVDAANREYYKENRIRRKEDDTNEAG